MSLKHFVQFHFSENSLPFSHVVNQFDCFDLFFQVINCLSSCIKLEHLQSKLLGLHACNLFCKSYVQMSGFSRQRKVVIIIIIVITIIVMNFISVSKVSK